MAVAVDEAGAEDVAGEIDDLLALERSTAVMRLPSTRIAPFTTTSPWPAITRSARYSIPL